MFVFGGNTGTKPVGCMCLALSGNIIKLAFNCQQVNAFYFTRVNALALDVPAPARQEVLLEYDIDGVQIELGRHVQHRVVLVVKTPVRFGVVIVAFDQVEIEIVM